MGSYISVDRLAEAVLHLNSAGCNNSFIDYLLVLSAQKTQGSSTVVVSGSTLRPNTDRAKGVFNSDSDVQRYYNPLSGEMLSTRHWTNGPSDTVPRWSAREHSPFETVTDSSARSKTVRVLPFDGADIQAFFSLTGSNRPRLLDMALWWYRRENLDGLLNHGVLTAGSLCEAFLAEVELSADEAAQLFLNPLELGDQSCIDLSDTQALPYEPS